MKTLLKHEYNAAAALLLVVVAFVPSESFNADIFSKLSWDVLLDCVTLFRFFKIYVTITGFGTDIVSIVVFFLS